ncbi:HD domain-containing phosphohydrolase [Desulfobacterales bacterium HSG17]|nr:HD domain-containing phosphohydrolase [Desulfobacterales bacterium HSG17]
MKKISLKKLLKPREAKPILQKISHALDNIYGVAVLVGSRVLFSLNEGNDAYCPDYPQNIFFPLMIQNQKAGGLVIWPFPNSAETSHSPTKIHQIMEMALLLLQEIINREYAKKIMTDETLEQYREVALLQRSALNLNTSLRMQDVTCSLLSECAGGSVQAEMGMLFYKNLEKGAYEELDRFGAVQQIDLCHIVSSRLFIEIAESRKGEIINDPASDTRWQNEVKGIESLLCIPLHSSGDWSGVLVLASQKSEISFSSADLKRITAIASIAATAMANAHHFEALQKMLESLIQSMATAIDSRDPCTSGHSRRVAQFAVQFAEVIDRDELYFPNVHFNEDQKREVYYASLLHDVGKIGIREEVLTKAERLPIGRLEIIHLRLALWGNLTGLDWRNDYKCLETINKANVISETDRTLIERLSASVVQIGTDAEPLLTPEEKACLLIPRGNLMPGEWDEIRRHPVESQRILQTIPFPQGLKNIILIVRQHHEKLNGNGYPDGIDASDILFQSRMVAILDVYDALTAKDRPYKKAMPREIALRIIREEGDFGNFDNDLVSLFCQKVHDITMISNIRQP